MCETWERCQWCVYKLFRDREDNHHGERCLNSPQLICKGKNIRPPM
ncbi:MAG: hypothetical protein MUO27_07880 [Sedimentisphaerales bacterium]|nr:hypothetical protein [Sedimentisphaerales bacterium]